MTSGQESGRRSTLRRISIVIPVLNGGADLAHCLSQIAVQATEDPVEIVVVDSASSDESVEIARGFGASVISIERSQFNHGATRNLGARRASGEILVFISQDAYPADRDWLERLTEPLRTDPDLAGVYGRQLPHDAARSAEQFFLNSLYGDRARRQQVRSPDELSMETTIFSNVNSAIRREVWERFAFASDLIMAEDQEWAARVLAAGYALGYEPKAAVRHSHAYTLGSAFRRFFDLGVASDRSFLASGAGSKRVLRRRALAYAREELSWLWRSGRALEIPFTGLYESTKMVALLLGTRYRSLPRTWVRRLSGTPAFWQ